MSPEQWKKVKSIFNQASDLPKSQRSSFLAQFDDKTRLEVTKMLDAIDEESLLLNEPIIDFKIFEETELPEKIGDYKIIREVGHGGMGTVYEAVRETENFTQKVALKVIKRGMNNDIILKRFRSEQQILASLEHPNIGRFLDGGKTAENLPFYAMEFIEGLPIDEFCRQKNLSVEEKVKLFRDVCSAVSYAHTNLIVHRDLKPSNIIVTEKGISKLLDFGIAKVLDVDSKEIGTATQLGMMTPQYASPEQIRGEKVTTLSDVYSLGVIFYEILTSDKPYQTEGKNYAEILEIIAQTEPQKPSENRQIKIHPPKLKGDLDTIVLKSLQKLPERRYQSVEQFSEDLRRHLVGLPITARPDTFQYRLSKFVERNKVAVAAAVLVFISLLIGIGVASWQAYRAEKQKLLAEKRFSEVRTIANNVVFKYHDEIAKLNGSTAAREMLVKDATIYLDNLASDTENDSDLERELGLAYLKLGDVQGAIYTANIGNTGGAIESYQKSINLLEKVVAERPYDVQAKDDLIKAINVKVALMARVISSSEEKIALLDKSSKLLEEILKVEPENPKRLNQLILLYIRYGDSVGQLKNRESLLEKLKYHQKSLPFADKLALIEPNEPKNLKTFLVFNQRIGTDYFWLGENAELNNLTDEAKSYFQQALPFHRKMLDLNEKLVKLFPDDLNIKRNRFSVYSTYAETLSRNNETEESLKFAKKALELSQNFQAEDINNQEAKFDTARVYELLGKIYLTANLNDSAKNYKKSLEISEEIFKIDPNNSEALNLCRSNAEKLIGINEKLGKQSEADFYQKKLKQLREIPK